MDTERKSDIQVVRSSPASELKALYDDLRISLKSVSEVVLLYFLWISISLIPGARVNSQRSRCSILCAWLYNLDSSVGRTLVIAEP